MENTRNRDTVDDNSGVLARTTMATVLIVAAVAALAITSLIRTHERATAQTAAQTPVMAQPAPTAATIPMSVPLDSGDVGPFAFGYLVFDWDPRAPHGVPGFDSWPPSGNR